MTRRGGGSFGGGAGGSTYGSHGRAGGGSFGGPPRHPHHHPPPPPLLPHHHRPPPPMIYPATYYTVPVAYSQIRGGPGYQTVPPPVRVQYDNRTTLLNQSKAVFTFTLLVLLIGTIWLYFGPYGSTVIQLGVHDSRLLTARSFFVDSIRLKNRYEVEGPVFHEFNRKPALNEESSWLDYQNETFNYEHRRWVPLPLDLLEKVKIEFYYWMNKGSTVQVNYALNIVGNSEPVFFAFLKDDKDDLSDYWEKPDRGSSVRLREHGQLPKYEARADADYVLSLVNHNKKDARMGADTWEIQISYGTRWTAVILLFSLVILGYLVSKSMIMGWIHDLDPSPPEQEPLVLSQETEATAPTLPASIAQEDLSNLKDEVPEDKLCSVCLDAPKDSFFVPCGHRATCYSCGLRISKADPPNCPICRQPIVEVKKIYDA